MSTLDKDNQREPSPMPFWRMLCGPYSFQNFFAESLGLGSSVSLAVSVFPFASIVFRECSGRHADNREGLYFPGCHLISSSSPVFCSLVDPATGCPSVIPYAEHFNHVVAFERKLVSSTRLVRPNSGYFVPRVDFVLRIVTLEERQLLCIHTTSCLRRWFIG